MNFFPKTSNKPPSSTQPKTNLSYNYKNSETKRLIPPPDSQKTSKTQQIFSSYLNKFTDSVGQKFTQSVSAVTNLTNKTEEVSNTLTNWKYFLGFFIAGLLFIALSMPYLTILVIAPQKFSGLFSLGSISILISVAILKGPYNFIKSFVKKDKILFSLVYFFSLFGTFYVALIQKSYILVILFSFIQVFLFF